MIKKYRKKPIEIDAIQYTGNNVSEIENFVGTNLLHYNTQEKKWLSTRNSNFRRYNESFYRRLHY